jgi:hypothetical protein
MSRKYYSFFMFMDSYNTLFSPSMLYKIADVHDIVIKLIVKYVRNELISMTKTLTPITN